MLYVRENDEKININPFKNSITQNKQVPDQRNNIIKKLKRRRSWMGKLNGLTASCFFSTSPRFECASAVIDQEIIKITKSQNVEFLSNHKNSWLTDNNEDEEL